MPASFDLVTIDAVDSRLLANFWSAALFLHETEEEDQGRWIVLGSTRRERILGIQRITGLEIAPGAIAGSQKVRIHLDLACALEEFAAEVNRLVSLGARELRPRRVESYGSIATLADPEGNMFDLCAYVSAER